MLKKKKKVHTNQWTAKHWLCNATSHPSGRERKQILQQNKMHSDWFVHSFCQPLKCTVHMSELSIINISTSRWFYTISGYQNKQKKTHRHVFSHAHTPTSSTTLDATQYYHSNNKRCHLLRLGHKGII